MKQIIKNKYLKSFEFSSLQELTTFFDNQKTENKLFIKDTFGMYYYCYICYHSLTRDKIFALSFSSDEEVNELDFLFWDDQKTIILNTGDRVYLISDQFKIKTFFTITTPLIGLCLITQNKLLLLEEASMKFIDNEGNVLKNETFDLIETFEIKDAVLSIQTSQEHKVIELV